MNKKIVALTIIIIIAAFFRLYNITGLPPGLYPDEAMNGNNALEALSTGNWKIFYPENNGREGLFMNIQAVFLQALMPFSADGNPEPWMLRLPSAIFGILSVLGIYFLTKELFNKKIALLSSFFLATSFWHINFSRIGFRAIMAPFFLIWATYFLIKSLQANNYKLTAIIGGLLFGLGFYSYIAYRVMPLLIAIIFFYFLYQHREHAKKIILSTFYFLLSTFVVALPIGLYFLKNPADFFGRTIQVSVSASQSPIKNLAINTAKTLGMFNFIGDGNWRHNISGAPEMFWPVGILFIIGVILIIFKAKSYKLQATSLFGWFFLAMLPVIISDEGIPHALRSILLIPPTIIFAGFGGIWLWEKIFMKIQNRAILKIFHIACLIFLVALSVQAYYAYFIQWGKNPNVQGAFAADYVQIGKELNALPKELPKYVLVQANGVNVRGIPMPIQTTMFITNTFTPEKQKEKNIFYILPGQENQIPNGAYKAVIK